MICILFICLLNFYLSIYYSLLEFFLKKIVETVIKWAEESEIENRELVRQMFHLLLRAFNGIGEV